MQKTLTQEDRKKIQKKLRHTFLFIPIVIAFFSIIYFFVIRKMINDSDSFSYLFVGIFGLFALAFLGVIGYMVSIFIKDLKENTKDCFEGVIENKRLNIKKSTSKGAGVGRGGRSRSSTSRYYYMIVDGTEYKIEYEMYGNIKVGDTIYFEMTPKSKTILSYDILESKGAEAEKNAPRLQNKSYPTSKVRQAPLSQKDKESMHAYYHKKIRKRLTIITIVGLPIFGLIYNDLALLALLIFPLPIILLYQVYKSIMLYSNYKKSMESGRKKLTQTHITDKLFTTITHNGSKSIRCKIVTTYKNIDIPEDVYLDFETGDEIIIHEALHIPNIIGIERNDQYYPF